MELSTVEREAKVTALEKALHYYSLTNHAMGGNPKTSKEIVEISNEFYKFLTTK